MATVMPRLSGSAKRKVCSRPGRRLQAKLGPKPDLQAARRISRAARRLAHGARWPELYERFLPGWKELNPVAPAARGRASGEK